MRDFPLPGECLDASGLLSAKWIPSGCRRASVSEPEVPKLCNSPGGGSSGIKLIEGPTESLDSSDFNDSLGNLGDQDEGVSDLVLREDPCPC